MKSLPVSLSLILFLSLTVPAQNIRDSTQAYPMIAGTLGLQLPSADLAERFGPSFSVGPSFLYKTRSNSLFGLDYNFIFSEKVKNADSIFSGIQTSDGNIIDGNGMFAEYFLYESSFLVSAKAGKVLSVRGSNPNSGLMLMGSLGVLQNKIWIYTREETAPQISGDYKKGYDQLRNGLAINEFIGYFHASDNGRINFYLGLEGTQAMTRSRRSYDFTTKSKDTSTKLDMLWGVKFAWVFPIYRTVPKEYYYY